LVKTILFPALKKIYGGYGEKTGKFDKIEGDINKIIDVEFVDQNPIGKSSRSNPATYVKAYDDIRTLFSEQQLAKIRAYKPGYFSFNIEGGRCEECEGDGFVKIEMQFMANVTLICESCSGKRFKDEVLDVKFKEKNITDILEMTVNQALVFFSGNPKSNALENKIIQKLQPLADVGLGYIKLGQASSSLSGGEAQRIKLASFLTKGFSDKPTLFIFDEPTTGLHFHDINKLKSAFDALINNGHTVIVIEHNMDIIKCADWIIDLGPSGGKNGGEVLFEGLPEDLVNKENSFTAKFLKNKLAN
jgi:excinuclease ABC subunit A